MNMDLHRALESIYHPDATKPDEIMFTHYASKEVSKRTGLTGRETLESLTPELQRMLVKVSAHYKGYLEYSRKTGLISEAEYERINEYSKNVGYDRTTPINKKTGLPFGSLQKLYNPDVRSSITKKRVMVTDAGGGKRRRTIEERSSPENPMIMDLWDNMRYYHHDLNARLSMEAILRKLEGTVDLATGNPVLMYEGTKYQTLAGEDIMDPAKAGLVELHSVAPISRHGQAPYVHPEIKKFLEEKYGFEKPMNPAIRRLYRVAAATKQAILWQTGDNMMFIQSAMIGELGPVKAVQNLLSSNTWVTHRLGGSIDPKTEIMLSRNGIDVEGLAKAYYDEMRKRPMEDFSDALKNAGLLDKAVKSYEDIVSLKGWMDDILYGQIKRAAGVMFEYKYREALGDNFDGKPYKPRLTEREAEFVAATVTKNALHVPDQDTFTKTTGNMMKYWLISRSLLMSNIRTMVTAIPGVKPRTDWGRNLTMGHGMNEREYAVLQEFAQAHMLRQGMVYMMTTALVSYMNTKIWPWERERIKDWFKMATGFDEQGNMTSVTNPLLKELTDDFGLLVNPAAFVVARLTPTVKAIAEDMMNTRFMPGRDPQPLIPTASTAYEAAKIRFHHYLVANGPANAFGKIADGAQSKTFEPFDPILSFLGINKGTIQNNEANQLRDTLARRDLEAQQVRQKISDANKRGDTAEVDRLIRQAYSGKGGLGVRRSLQNPVLELRKKVRQGERSAERKRSVL